MSNFASFAPDAIKEAGNSNLWDNADATITGFRFSREMPDNYKIEPKPGEEIAPVGAFIDFEIDGTSPVEERRVNQFFSLGAKIGLSFDIAQGGYALVPKTADAQIYSSNFTKFVKSLVDNGLPATVVAAGDFSKIIGLKAHWKRIEDKSRDPRTRTFKTKSGEEKTVTEYSKILLCTKIHALPAANTAAPASPAAAATEEFDLDTAATDYLLAALKAKGKPMQRSQLVLVVSQAAKDNVNRSAIAKRAQEEDFLTNLADLGLITYDAAGKGQPVGLAA